MLFTAHLEWNIKGKQKGDMNLGYVVICMYAALRRVWAARVGGGKAALGCRALKILLTY